MKKIKFVAVILAGMLLASCNQSASWISTTENTPWQAEEGVKVVRASGEADAVVDVNTKLQTIEGFGACFNELGWVALNRLSQAERDSVFRELFAPGVGANFTICRMPVGANDFSRDWYSYDETEGDFQMQNFSIENDTKTLIPYITSALEYKPDLKIWASPWSPPAWMKWNKHYACQVPPESLDPKFDNNLPPDRQGAEGTNMFILQKEYLQAYALYFSKFIEAYRQQGIDIFMVMPQNEFNSCQIFPSCTWTAAGLAEFVGKYLGPAMKDQNVKIMFGTMERPNIALVDTLLNDPLAGTFISGVGFQWAGKKAIPGIHEKYPDLKLYQTEQECGDGKNNMDYCLYAWSLMKHYLDNGASAYLYWNMALDEGGYSRWGWQQNSLITVDTISNTSHFNHEYYLMKHFSHFVKPGAAKLPVEGDSGNMLAFRNPDNSMVLVVRSEKNQQVKIKVGEKMIAPDLKAGSFNTFVLKL